MYSVYFFPMVQLQHIDFVPLTNYLLFRIIDKKDRVLGTQKKVEASSFDNLFFFPIKYYSISLK